MSALGWVVVVICVLLLCALVGVFVAIADEQSVYDEKLAQDDADELVKNATHDYYTRNRIKALSE